jgi:ATP-dependent DNA helicase RecG
MTLPISIDSLLHGKAVEWERLEFKAGWNPLAVLHSMCAFANDFHNFGGGYIVVGVAEKAGRPILPPVGIETDQLNAIQKEILHIGQNAMQPHFHPIIVPEVVDGKPHVSRIFRTLPLKRPWPMPSITAVMRSASQ